jgi:hypothetical protein
MVDRRMVEGVIEWYEDYDEKHCLCSKPDMDRVGYVFEITWQVKKLNGK